MLTTVGRIIRGKRIEVVLTRSLLDDAGIAQHLTPKEIDCIAAHFGNTVHLTEMELEAYLPHLHKCKDCAVRLQAAVSTALAKEPSLFEEERSQYEQILRPSQMIENLRITTGWEAGVTIS